MDQKVVASAIFRGKKAKYPESLNVPFADTRIDESEISPKVMQMIRHEKVKYVSSVLRFEGKGFKPKVRMLVLTRKAAYLLEAAKIKEQVEYSSIKGISTSNLSDGIVVIHLLEDGKQVQGDVIIQCDHVFEVVTRLCMLAKKEELVAVAEGSLEFQFSPGKPGTIDFTTGHTAQVYKAKNGHLTVVSTKT